MSLTKQDLREIVKALDPKFKQIDKRFEQVDKRFEQIDHQFKQITGQFKGVDDRFTKLHLEIGDMIAPLATKEEFHKEIARLNGRIDQFEGRIDQFEDRFEQFAGSTGVFQSRVIVRFDDLDDKLKEHDQQFERIIKTAGTHSETLRHHSQRIAKLEKAALKK